LLNLSGWQRTYQEKIHDCDPELQQHLESFESRADLQAQPIGPKPKGRKSWRNTPRFDLRTELYRITGIDWAQVNGMDAVTAQTVIAECYQVGWGWCPPTSKTVAKS
jgi:hypothetical protein